MREPALAVWSQMKAMGYKNIDNYLNRLNSVGQKDAQWENLVTRYGTENAKYMVETVFGLSPLILIGTGNHEKENSSEM